MLKKLFLRVALSVLGCAATLLWWTYHDKGSSVQSSSHIPAKVAEGGNQLEVSVETTTSCTMRIDFHDLRKPSGSQMLLQSWEKIPAGSHSWTIDVPSGLGGYIELDADHPEPGATLTQRVSINGKETFNETDRLDSPLEPNTAFFVQVYYQDYSKPSANPDEPSHE
jgi:hypothetical protein